MAILLNSESYYKVRERVTMKKKIAGIVKKTLCYAMIAAMVISFMPLSTTEVSAASFNKDKRVTGVKVTKVGSSYVQLSWSKYPGATGYQVYRAKSKGGNYKLQGTTSKLTYKNTGKMNKKYYYKVRAYYKKSDGSKKKSKYSKAVSGKPTLARTYTQSLTLKDSSIKITWSKVPEADGYQVLRYNAEKGEYKNLAKTKNLSFENTGLTKGKIYYYKVRPYKVINDKRYYGPKTGVIRARTKLAAPGGASVGQAADGLVVSWNGVGAAGYEVYRAESKDGSYKRLASIKSVSYKDKTATKGKTYYYKVRGYLKMNKRQYFGGYSAITSGVINDGVPIVKVTPTDYSVKLSWQAVKDISGYEVYRATSPNGSYKRLGINTKSPTWENDELTLGTLYYYKVRTYKKTGGTKKYGQYSLPVAGKTSVLAPTNIKASATSGKIKLTWTASKGASGYEITRSTSANGTFKKVGTSTTASFIDTNGLSKGSSYFYKIRGYSKYAGKTHYGAYSMSSASRDKVVQVAIGWLGYKESNGSHKKIIDVYNSNRAPGCGKLSYYVPWCAAFVSAVGIKAGATNIIVRHSYCPTMLSTYRNKGQYSSNKKYSPKPGDIIFYDWNNNNTPDHVGMIVSCSGNTVKAIEGNKNDAVGYRTFPKGYSLVQGYGLPAYNETSGIKYTGSNTKALAVAALEEAGIDADQPDGYSDIGSEYDTAETELSKGCGEDSTELQQMEVMLETLKKNADTKDLENSTESEYKAAFLYKLCQDANIEASIVAENDENGNRIAWVEAVLDGQLYKIDMTAEKPEPVKYTPGVSDYNEETQNAGAQEEKTETIETQSKASETQATETKASETETTATETQSQESQPSETQPQETE